MLGLKFANKGKSNLLEPLAGYGLGGIIGFISNSCDRIDLRGDMWMF